MQAAHRFFAEWFGETDPTRETLWVAHVDAKMDCVRLTSFEGDETGVSFPLRAIIADVISHRSAGILLAHNHPSGNPSPSAVDQRLTRLLVTAARAVDCAVLDHLVFGGTECTSFRQMGLL